MGEWVKWGKIMRGGFVLPQYHFPPLISPVCHFPRFNLPGHHPKPKSILGHPRAF